VVPPEDFAAEGAAARRHEAGAADEKTRGKGGAVSGSGRGIGQAIAMKLAAEGARSS